ncbi:putative helicase mov-10-B.1, partial [Pseudolycoriella hygida]
HLLMDKLPDYNLPSAIIDYESGVSRSIQLQDKITKWENNKSLMRANESNYIESLRLMIYLEEAAERIELEKCNLKSLQLHHIVDSEFYFSVEPDGAHSFAVLKEFDKFDVLTRNGEFVTTGHILYKENNKIYVEINSAASVQQDEFYDIVFQNNRTTHLLQHQALNLVQSHKLFDILISNPSYYTNWNSEDNESSITVPPLHTSLQSTYAIDLNAEQQEAVVNILQGKFYPLPYLLYGPPGTGKTKTLVASILHIVGTSDDNVLVCAQTNAACDELTVRLKEFLDESVLFRLYSKNVNELTNSILPYSNYFNGELKYPHLKYLYKFRVVVCTLATAGCLTRAHCNPYHFNYVIIDECASAVEPMALMPIVGLCSTVGEIHTKIVLAGDPKQLDAVIKSQTAGRLGFSTSLMEHFFHFPLYQRHAKRGIFNAKYITQLVRNYRSHPVILHVPNKLFYDGTLQAEVVPDLAELNVSLPKLNKDFPVVFKSVQGISIKPEDDTSSYNVEEINEVMGFIRTILNSNERVKQSDIGVISPYKLQCEFLRLLCKRDGFHEITVGTAEKFQGQERKIIIASTVCSSKEAPSSFVSDPQICTSYHLFPRKD